MSFVFALFLRTLLEASRAPPYVQKKKTGAEVGVGLVQTATETGAGLVEVVASNVDAQTDALQDKEAKEEPKEEEKK